MKTPDAVVQGHADTEDFEAFLARHRRRVVADVWRALAWPAALFVVIALAAGADLAADVANGTGGRHLTAELVMLGVALAGVIGTALKLRAALQDGAALLGELEIARLDLAHWRGESVKTAEGERPGRSGV